MNSVKISSNTTLEDSLACREAFNLASRDVGPSLGRSLLCRPVLHPWLGAHRCRTRDDSLVVLLRHGEDLTKPVSDCILALNGILENLLILFAGVGSSKVRIGHRVLEGKGRGA